MKELATNNAPPDVFMELYSFPEKYIASDECQKDYLYWVASRSVGELAICRGVDEYDRVQFEGWRNKLGSDFLFTEYHWDDDSYVGTVKPYVELEQVPELDSPDSLMDWLLLKHIELQEERVAWLKGFPRHVRISNEHVFDLQDAEVWLQELYRVKQEGFNVRPMLTFREIMAAQKKQKIV
jgi:hypothetical protein